MIGNVKKGGFTSANFKIQPKNNGIQELDFTIEYTDTTGSRTKINKTIEMNTNLFNNIDKVEVEDNEKSSSSGKTTFFVVLIILVVGGFVYYKKKKNGKKN